MNLAKLSFVALDISGKSYLTWVIDAKLHLEAGNLRNAVKEGKHCVLSRSGQNHDLYSSPHP